MAKKSKDKNSNQPIAPLDRPQASFTGSQKQPMNLALDSSDNESSASSFLEVLPPQKKTPDDAAAAIKSTTTTMANNKKCCTSSTLLGDGSAESDSDDSILPEKVVFSKSSNSKKTAVRKAQPTSSQSSAATSTGSPSSTTSSRSSQTANKDLSKQQEKERKKAEQERKKQEKLAQKQAEQARKKAERQALKEQKQQEKEAAKEIKKRQREAQQQASGKWATAEIVLMVDPPLFRRREEHSCYDWKEHDEMEKHNFLVKEYPSALGGEKCHALQWIRREYAQGGASEAWDELRKNNVQGFTHSDRLVMVIDDAKFFIELLQRTPQDDADDDYPKLRQWLVRLEHGWKAAWPHSTTKCKVMLMLHRPVAELDRQWVEFRRANKNSQRQDASLAPPTAEEFHDAVTWMLIEFQVESMCCDSYEEIWTAALKMTRAIAKSPYDRPLTELNCIKRLKPTADDKAPNLDKAKDTWIRQLQQLPGMSETKARTLVLHYPTMQALWQGLAEAGHEDGPELVAGCLNTNSYQKKLSECIHRLFTSLDPEELV